MRVRGVMHACMVNGAAWHRSAKAWHVLMVQFEPSSWLTVGVPGLIASMKAYAETVPHRVVMVQLVMEKLAAGGTEGMKAAGMKALVLFGG